VDLRKAKGLTQEDVSTRIGISVFSYNRIERGSRPLSRKHLEDLARVLGVDVSDIEATGVQLGGKAPRVGSISDKLVQARNGAGMTQEQLAAAIGVSQATIQRYETTREPPTGQLQKIAAVLELPLAWFTSGDDPYLEMLLRAYHEIDPEIRDEAGAALLAVALSFVPES
jgi:transcriptional regulator with XRE-family HTH domain